MRSSVLIAATLSGVVSAWPQLHGTAGTGGPIYPTGTGIPHGPGPVSLPSVVFPPSGRPTGFPTYTTKPLSTGGVFPPGGHGTGISGGATGTGTGGSGNGPSTLPPSTITITSDVPSTTTKTVLVPTTIITTVRKFDPATIMQRFNTHTL